MFQASCRNACGAFCNEDRDRRGPSALRSFRMAVGMKREARLYAARREYELITPPSFDVQTMSLTHTELHSSGGAVKSGGK
jgi:hypothetical protein